MRKTLTSKKKKAHVLAENCMGCGSCILGCEQKAITFELVRPPEHIPSEKTIPIRSRPKFFGYTAADLK
jgi:ferredoxin